MNVEKVYDTLVSVTFLVYTLPTTKSLNSSTLGLDRNAWPWNSRPHTTCFFTMFAFCRSSASAIMFLRRWGWGGVSALQRSEASNDRGG